MKTGTIRNKTDKYGNNTNFPSEIVSNMTKKGLIGKWCKSAEGSIYYALTKYHLGKAHNIDANDMQSTRFIFESTYSEIYTIQCFLEDLTIKTICGIEDIFANVYGIDSDELYMCREFMKLYNNINNWDETSMWNNCPEDERLRNILLPSPESLIISILRGEE